jgi:hypothetical protein
VVEIHTTKGKSLDFFVKTNVDLQKIDLKLSLVLQLS